MRTTNWAIIPVALVAASAADAQDAAVRALVDRFEAARIAHDPVALAATLAPDYEEISPVGAVDSRADVLGFYAPQPKRPAPAMVSDHHVLRSFGDTALMTVRVSFTPPGAPAARSIRVRYVARRTGRAWLLVSAQYTPIPPARAG